jgi:outer membrane lipoprotein-sorting protein
MAGLPNLIGLLYRADWTRLSLSAELRSETDRNLLPRPRRENQPQARWYRAWPTQQQDNGRYVRRGALLIGPGGRWRLEGPVPGQDAEGEAAEGNDGERGWSWRPPEMDAPPPLPSQMGAAYPPPPELFCPSGLLGGYTLEELGPVTVAGRDAIAVAATPRRDVLGSGPAELPYDRIEFAVDAELGILLRRAETARGELVTLTELTDLTMNPPEAADPGRFTAPPGSHRGETLGEELREKLGGPGWTAADRAAGGLGALIRHAPHRPGHGAAGEQPEAMPSPDPAPLEPADDSPPPDEVLDLLYRSGEPRDLGATARQWRDLVAVAAWLPEGIRAVGRGGFASLFDTTTLGPNVARTDTRLRVSGPDRYRLDFSTRPQRNAPKTVACDGERRWRVFQDQTVIGPAAPLRGDIAFLADSCWLLRGRLSGGAELTYRGRPARQLRVTPVPGDAGMAGGSLLTFPAGEIVGAPVGEIADAPADAIVDAETGCLLRLISYAGDTLAIWSELDDISTEPADPDEFRVHVPPGTRTVEETGNPLTDTFAAMPGLAGTAARAAAETVTRTTSAVSAARTFLDDLRGRPRPPS